MASSAGTETLLHLEGTSSFYTHPSKDIPSPIRQAVWWIHLRQEIFSAYIKQRPVRLKLEEHKGSIFDVVEDDNAWFHQMLHIAARATQWAFGKDSPYDGWVDLKTRIESWEKNRPASFDPLFYCARHPEEGKWFPELCLATDEHGTTLCSSPSSRVLTSRAVECTQFLYLTKLIIATHDPTLPRIGGRMQQARAAMRVSSPGTADLFSKEVGQT